MTEAPSVTVVVVSEERCEEDTLVGLDGLHHLSWPLFRLEIVVVTSGGVDASQIRRSFPRVRMVQAPHDSGFGSACNLGAAAASGQFLGFVHCDVRPDSAWLAAAIGALDRDDEIGCVASKVLSWDGARVDFVGGCLDEHGLPSRPDQGAPHDGRWDEPSDVLYPSGTAMVLPVSVFRQLGGFDEGYGGIGQEVDLGWRTWLAGYRVRYVPTSIVYHRARAGSDAADERRSRRNALATLYTCLGAAELHRRFPIALGRAVEQCHDESDPSAVARELISGLDGLRSVRNAVQSTRRYPDEYILGRFGTPQGSTPRPQPAPWDDDLDAAIRDDRTALRILVVTSDMIGREMAGPAIRALQMASTLASEHDVVLASLVGADLSVPGLQTRHATADDLQELVDWSELIIFQGHFLHHHPWLTGLDDKVVVVDLYDPFQLENLELARHLTLPHRISDNHHAQTSINGQIRRGDFFLCASEKQRDFWLGNLAAMGRVNPRVYDEDPSLRSLIDVVPFGIPDQAPVRTGPGPRDLVDGISAEDHVILWGGGIYNWFDPATLIRAVADLTRRLADVRLLFMGTRHPNPEVPEMRVAVEAIELARSLGLLDKHVFFNDGWVAYADRQNYLLDADVGVSTHAAHIETEFSFRTRVLDYFWAGLPVIVSEGDALSRIVTERHVGLAVPAQDVEALSEGLFVLLTDEDLRVRCRRNALSMREELAWSRAAGPLVDFCLHARHAADLRPRRVPRPVSPPPPLLFPVEPEPWRWHDARHDLAVVRQTLREGGLRRLSAEAQARATRLIRRG